MSTNNEKRLNLLKAVLQGQPCKSYLIYDGLSRLTDVYEAPADAIDGGPCLRTTYTYTTVSSTLVQKRKETLDAWSSSYDI